MAGDECVTLHTAGIYRRGGQQRKSPLVNMQSVSWERVRSDVSRATVVISGRNCEDQAEALASIQAHADELVIWRGQDRVWEGPVMDVKWYPDRVEIVADDAGTYIFETVCSRAWPPPPEGLEFMTDRVRQIIEYEMTTPYTVNVGLTDPDWVTMPRWENLGTEDWPFEEWGGPANVLPFLDVRDSTGTGGLRTYADVTAFQMYIGEHLDNLARGGLDYTTVGRSLVVWDSATELGRTSPLTDTDFLGDTVVIASGRDQASVAHVVAQEQEDEDGNPLPSLGSAGGPDPFYGVWADLRTREDEDAATTQALNTQARRNLSGRTVTPLQISTPAGVRVGTSVKITDLVPGVIVPVRAVMNLRQVAQDMLIDKVTVTEDASGESVNLGLDPWGGVVDLDD